MPDVGLVKDRGRQGKARQCERPAIGRDLVGQGVGRAEVRGQREGLPGDGDRADPERVVKLENVGRRARRLRSQPGVQIGAEQGGRVEGRLARQETVRGRDIGIGAADGQVGTQPRPQGAHAVLVRVSVQPRRVHQAAEILWFPDETAMCDRHGMGAGRRVHDQVRSRIDPAIFLGGAQAVAKPSL